MELQSILSADYLDIIFDKRNKTYGSYELRKNYSRRAAKAAGLVLTALLLAIGANTFASRLHPEEKITLHTPSSHDLRDIPVDIPQKKIDIPPPPDVNPNPPAAAATIINTTPEIAPDPEVTAPAPTVDDMRDKVSGTVNNPGNGGLLPATGEIPGDGTDNLPKVIDKPAVVDAPVEYVEQMPDFNGDVKEYLSKHIQYPEMARSTGTKGKVVIRFVVNEDGSISNAKVIKGIGGGCEEEALRVLNGMPKWKPGRQNGKAVKVFMTLPVSFVLQQ